MRTSHMTLAAAAVVAVARRSGQAAAPAWYEELLKSGALGYMVDGGIFMWPIFFLGVLAFGVIIERYRSLKMLTTDTSALRDEVQRLLQADRVEEALKKCDAEQGPVPAILCRSPLLRRWTGRRRRSRPTRQLCRRP